MDAIFKMLQKDESCFELMKRWNEENLCTGIEIIDCLEAKRGKVVELYGKTNVGKTKFLQFILSNLILPQYWEETKINGNEFKVIFVDLQLNFQISSLSSFLKHRILKLLGENHPSSPHLFRQSLNRLQIVQCKVFFLNYFSFFF